MVRLFLCMVMSALAACTVSAQIASTPPHFEVADVHASRVAAAQVARGPFITGTRYDLRNATVVDLIVRAYDVTADKVLDGPSWLEYDRFDITATVPPKTSVADAKLMLQALLADRFRLATHKDVRPLPSYVLTAPKGKQKLKEADGSGDTGCRTSLDQPRQAASPGAAPPIPTVSFTCHNTSMAEFAEGMRNMPFAQQFIGPNPVEDKTGIEGKWDFNLKYTLPLFGPGGDNITLQEAVDKQLSLKLDQETISLPVMVVEKASRPSPNEPDVAKKIPALPEEFEVATVKPLDPIGTGAPVLMGIRQQPGGRVEISGLPLKLLIQQAWGVQNDAIVDAPKFTETDRYSIVAKMPVTGTPSAGNPTLDSDALEVMLRALLKDRFKLTAHIEDRPMTAYTLTASKPKLKKADPATRSKWTDTNNGLIVLNGGNGGGPPSRTVKFQNISMAQLAEKLQFLAGTYIHAPVIDATGLEGGYDFTLTFSPIAPAMLANFSRAPGVDGGANSAADPIGGVSLFEAVEKQLGLKLVEQKRPVSVLVIDHIEQKPTDN